MDQVKVDLLHTEAAQALLGLGDQVTASREVLGGDEYLFARHAAVAKGAADTLLIAVGLSRVNVPVPGLQRPAHGVDALGSVRDLPDA